MTESHGSDTGTEESPPAEGVALDDGADVGDDVGVGEGATSLGAVHPVINAAATTKIAATYTPEPYRRITMRPFSHSLD